MCLKTNDKHVIILVLSILIFQMHEWRQFVSCCRLAVKGLKHTGNTWYSITTCLKRFQTFFGVVVVCSFFFHHSKMSIINWKIPIEIVCKKNGHLLLIKTVLYSCERNHMRSHTASGSDYSAFSWLLTIIRDLYRQTNQGLTGHVPLSRVNSRGQD